VGDNNSRLKSGINYYKMMARLYLDNSYYFVTRSTFTKERYFNSNERKKIILDRFILAQKKFDFSLYAFSIISNHYHYLTYLKQGKDLSLIEKFIAGGSSYELNKFDRVERRVWDNYWAQIIENEKGLRKVLGYILGNPLKHGEVKDFKELQIYQFSNYKKAIGQYGKLEIDDLIVSVEALNLETRSNFEKLIAD